MSFVNAIDLFLEACPGPPLAQLGLRLAALQPVKGIRGFDSKVSVASERESDAGPYPSSVRQIAKRVRCRPAYLSRSAGKHGYSFANVFGGDYRCKFPLKCKLKRVYQLSISVTVGHEDSQIERTETEDMCGYGDCGDYNVANVPS